MGPPSRVGSTYSGTGVGDGDGVGVAVGSGEGVGVGGSDSFTVLVSKEMHIKAQTGAVVFDGCDAEEGAVQSVYVGPICFLSLHPAANTEEARIAMTRIPGSILRFI